MPNDAGLHGRQYTAVFCAAVATSFAFAAVPSHSHAECISLRAPTRASSVDALSQRLYRSGARVRKKPYTRTVTLCWPHVLTSSLVHTKILLTHRTCVVTFYPPCPKETEMHTYTHAHTHTHTHTHTHELSTVLQHFVFRCRPWRHNCCSGGTS